MKTFNRDISDYLFVLIAFYIIDDAVTVYKFLRFGYGLLQEWGYEWGIVLRIIGPAGLIFVGVWRFGEKNKRLAYCLFGVSRLLSFHSAVIQRNLNLGLVAMDLALLTDIVALYMSVIAFKRSRIRKGNFSVRRLLLAMILAVCVTLLRNSIFSIFSPSIAKLF
jgi:hypothetical protein